MAKRQKATIPSRIVCNADPAHLRLPAQELYLCAPADFEDFFIERGIWSEEDRLHHDPSIKKTN